MTSSLETFTAHLNETRYQGQPQGHYESFFQRANHRSRPLAFWIRYLRVGEAIERRDYHWSPSLGLVLAGVLELCVIIVCVSHSRCLTGEVMVSSWL